MHSAPLLQTVTNWCWCQLDPSQSQYVNTGQFILITKNIYINNLFVVKAVQWFSDLCFEQYHGKYNMFTSIVLGWHENISNLGTWNQNSCICKAALMERVLTIWKWNGHNLTDLYRKKGLLQWKWNGKKVKQWPAGQLHSYLYKTGDPLY